MTTPSTRERRAAPPLERMQFSSWRRSNESRPAEDVDDVRPATAAQARLWLQERLNTANRAYNCVHALRAVGRLPLLGIELAVRALVERHPILRASFVQGESGVVEQRLHGVAAPVRYVDLSGLQDPEARALKLIQDEGLRAFDLGAGPLWRVCVVCCDTRRHLVAFVAHHIILDDWSLGLLLQEMTQLLQGYGAGRPAVPALGEPPPRSVLRPSAADLEAARRFWEQELAGVPVLALPAERTRSARRRQAGDKLFQRIDSQLADAVRQRAHERGVTPFAVYLAAFRTVLASLANQRDFAIGVPVLNRGGRGDEAVVGLMANVLALRNPIEQDGEFWRLVEAESRRELAALQHGSLPFDEVVDLINPPRHLGADPLFQVMFVYQQRGRTVLLAPNVRFEPLDVKLPVARFELTLMAVEVSGEVSLSLEFDRDLFTPLLIEQLLRDYRTVVTRATTEPNVRLAELLLPGAPALRAPALSGPRRALWLRLNEAARAMPDRVALRVGSSSTSYAELWRRIVRLGSDLARVGVGPEVHVAILLPRCESQVTGMFAVWLAGGAFAPLDPDAPPERTRAILEGLWPRVVLASRAKPPPAGPWHTLYVDALPFEAAAHPAAPRVTAESAAYVIHTSGSTGTPKGVVGLHGGLEARLDWSSTVFPFSSQDVALYRARPTFVDAICEVVGPVLAGCPIVVASAEEAADARLLLACAEREGVTRMTAPPTVLRAMLDALDDHPELTRLTATLELMTSSGEALTELDVRRWRASVPGAALLNLYGSSEVSADVLHHLASADSESSAQLGQPIAGTSLRLRGLCDGPGLRGGYAELGIVGPSHARGYLNDAAATANAYAPDPASDASGARVFWTGDNVRTDFEQRIFYVGRRDRQVKLHGIRVELGEVEAALRAEPDIEGAAAKVLEGSARLAAWVVVRGGRLEEGSLRARLQARVPAYLVPDQIVRVDALPQTRSGKIDYAALHAVDSGSERDTQPRSLLEGEIMMAWRNVLGVQEIDRTTPFYAFGAHSLTAARVARILSERLLRDVPVASLFEHPTIHELAAWLESSGGQQIDAGRLIIEPNPGARFERFPLTPMQQAYVTGRDARLLSGGVSIHGYTEIEGAALDVERFERSLNELIARHDMLRAVLVSDTEQQVLERVPEYSIARVDLRSLPRDQADARLAELREELSSQVLDLRRWPAFDIRASLRVDAPPRFHVSFDATFVDGWSQGLLLNELMRRMGDRDAATLPAPPSLSFRDYNAAMQRLRASRAHEGALSAWKRRLSELPEAPALPTPSSSRPPRVVQLTALVPSEVGAHLLQKAARRRASLIDVLLAAFATVLSEWSSSPRFTLNVPSSGRLLSDPVIERMIGPFADFGYAAFDLTDPTSFGALVDAAHAELAWLSEHQVVSGMELARELIAQRGFQLPTPIVFTSLNFGGNVAAPQREHGFVEVHSASQTPQVWLDNRVHVEAGNALRITWDVFEDMFPPGLPADMLRRYTSLLTEAARNDWSSWEASSLPAPAAASSEEAHELVGPLGSQFWSQRATRPDAAAVLGPFEPLSYEELGTIALGISSWLVREGVAQGDIVAIAMEKGWEQVAGVLGVSRIGAVFAPLEVAQPFARLQELTRTLRAKAVLVAEGSGSEHGWCEGLPVLSVCRRSEPVSELPGPEVRPDALAYVIHTSGSSGRPKGVMVAHRGAWNTIAEINRNFAVQPSDRVLSVSALTFDLAIWDIFGTLAAGAALVMPSGRGAQDPAAWLEEADRHGVTIWNSAPPLMSLALERARSFSGGGLGRLRLALLSGDWIPVTMPDAIRRLAPGCTVVSLGGATEGSIWSVLRVVDAVDRGWQSIPYGRAMRGQAAWVLDHRQRVRPSWADGELFLGGAGVALGYWDSPDLTEERFIVHPATGQRLYRTGDRARLLPDGELELLGRIDRQVKINGRRIEPGEIEAACLRCDDIEQAVVTPFRAADGQMRLAAHVVRARQPEASVEPARITAEGVRKFARRALGIRRRIAPGERVTLGALPLPEEREAFFRRRSRRIFAPVVADRRRLRDLLSVLTQIDVAGSVFPKRRYASAGNLYAVDLYVIVRPGTIRGLPGGFYQLDPTTGDLVQRADFGDSDSGLEPNNDLLRSASVALFLAAELSLIEESYPGDGLRFATLEAGAMSQLLEQQADACGLGLCQIGDVGVWASTRCRLNPSQVVINTLVGGPVDEDLEPQKGFLADATAWREHAVSTARWISDRGSEVRARARLAEVLPAYLVPQKFLFHSELPTTPNGKIDAKELARRAAHFEVLTQARPHATRHRPAALQGGDQTHGGSIASRPDDAVAALTEIWTETLGQPVVDMDDSFLALGGTSMQALRLMSAIEQRFGVAPPIMDFLQAPTLASLAQRVRELQGTPGSAEHVALPKPSPDLANRQQPFPLSLMQQAYVVGSTDRWEFGTSCARYYFEVDVERLDVERLERALRRLIVRHDMLRAVFVPPFSQRILPRAPEYRISRDSLVGVAGDVRDERLTEMRKRISAGARSLEAWPLFDVHLVDLDDIRSRLHVALELFLVDARSIQLLHGELLLLYEQDRDDLLPPLAFSFRDHLLAELALRAGPAGMRDREYWLRRLDMLPPAPALPSNPEACQSPFGRPCRLSRTLEASAFEAFKARAARYGATPSGALCAAFAVALAQWTSEPRFTLNLSTANRWPFHEDVPRIVGDFTATTLLEIDLTARTFAELLRVTQGRLLQDLQHHLFSGLDVMRELNRRSRRVGGFLTPVVFTSVLGVENVPAPPSSFLKSEPVFAVSQTPQVSLDHQVFEIDGALSYNWDYSSTAYPAGLIEDIIATYDVFLRRLASDASAWEESL
jgi:amino acid adenylation domain-containing protein